jgi:hypothetical protein
MTQTDPRAELDRLIRENGDEYVALSRLLGRNAAYVQQYIKRGSPKILPEKERAVLARYFGVDERVLGAPDRPKGAGLRLVPKLAVGASAGAGALTHEEALAGKVGFDEAWLRKMGVEPAQVSLIRVEGDSMQPTLNDGDDIMVDKAAALRPLKDGVHVLRMDDALMVKRLVLRKGGRLSVLSDNPAYPDWRDLDAGAVSVIGRVVWVGRRL